VNLAAGSFHPAIGRQVRADRALVEQLEALGAKAGLMLMHEQRGWASPTFTGTRHRFTFEFRGAAAIEQGENLITFLPENEFTIPSQLVADAAITNVVYSTVDKRKLHVEFEMLLLDESR
jgi:hypothetical protein